MHAHATSESSGWFYNFAWINDFQIKQIEGIDGIERIV